MVALAKINKKYRDIKRKSMELSQVDIDYIKQRTILEKLQLNNMKRELAL